MPDARAITNRRVAIEIARSPSQTVTFHRVVADHDPQEKFNGKSPDA